MTPDTCRSVVAVTVHVARVSDTSSAPASGDDAEPDRLVGGLLDPAPLDARERARLRRLRHPADATRYTVAHVLARRVVAAAVGCGAADVLWHRRCQRCGGPHGRPVPVVASGQAVPSVSVSSSGDLAVVALCWGAVVGVDVQAVDAVAAHSLAALAGREPLPADPMAVARWWVRRESVLKATGDGLTVPVSDLVVEDGAPPRLTAWAGRELPPVALVDLGEAGRGATGPGAGEWGAAAHVGCVAVLTDAVPLVTVVDAGAHPNRPLVPVTQERRER